MINTTSKILNARNFFICRYFSFHEQLKFRAHAVELSLKTHFITSGTVVLYKHIIARIQSYLERHLALCSSAR